MKKIVRLTEFEIRKLAQNIVNEYGAVWKNDGGRTSLTVDSDPDRDMNTNAMMRVDTRVFGNKDDILHHKGRSSSKSLTDQYVGNTAIIKTIENIISWVGNGRKGTPRFEPGIPTRSRNTLLRYIATMDDRELVAALEKTEDRYRLDTEIYTNKYKRVSGSEDGRLMRYNMFNVPGTNVKCVTMFSMTDFNFSDAIKHGYLRGNKKTDIVTGDMTDSSTSNKVALTYDDGVVPNIRQNFSLDGVQPGHYRQQYPNGGYTSVNQFIDKSVIYGAAILNKIGYHPDFIVSAPSSSNFNKYFCINLSNKIGAEYIEDFFKRNIVNVRLADGSDPDSLKEKGFSDSEILTFTSVVRNMAFNEINYLVCRPIHDFVKKYEKYFLTVPSKPGAEPKRGKMENKVPVSTIIHVLCRISYGTALNELGRHEYVANITKMIMYTNDKGISKQIPVDELYKNIMRFSGIGKYKRIYDEYLEAHYQFTDNLEIYVDKLSEGFVPKYVEKQFKITKLDKRFRGYIENAYVIADRHMTGDILQSRYRDAKFLIYDEDVNSGTTLRLVVDALNEKLPDERHQILCLANAYSSSGR